MEYYARRSNLLFWMLFLNTYFTRMAANGLISTAIMCKSVNTFLVLN